MSLMAPPFSGALWTPPSFGILHMIYPGPHIPVWTLERGVCFSLRQVSILGRALVAWYGARGGRGFSLRSRFQGSQSGRLPGPCGFLRFLPPPRARKLKVTVDTFYLELLQGWYALMVVPKHKAKHVNSCTTSMPSHSWFRLLKSPVVCGPQKSITSHTHKCTKTYHTLIYCRSGFRHILFGTWDHSSSCGRTLVAVHMYESPRETVLARAAGEVSSRRFCCDSSCDFTCVGEGPLPRPDGGWIKPPSSGDVKPLMARGDEKSTVLLDCA